MIAVFNQLDGINAVIYYTADIFRMAGADNAGALMQSVIVGLTNLVMTFVGMALIDRVGRKALLLVGSVTFVFSHVLAAWVFATHTQGWIVIAAMMGVVGSHAYSQGAVVWVVINELLPNAVRASRLGRSLLPDVDTLRGYRVDLPDHCARFRRIGLRVLCPDDGAPIRARREIPARNQGAQPRGIAKTAQRATFAGFWCLSWYP